MRYVRILKYGKLTQETDTFCLTAVKSAPAHVLFQHQLSQGPKSAALFSPQN